MLVLLLLILGGGTAAYFIAGQRGRKLPPQMIQAPDVNSTIREANYIRTGWQRDANRLLRDFLAAGSSAEKLPFILNGERLAARLEEFYGHAGIDDSDAPAEAFTVYELSEEDRNRGLFMMRYDQPPQFEMREFFRPLAPLEVQYGLDEADLLPGALARADNFGVEPMRVHAFFKRTAEGLKLDWEIFAQTKYRTFRDFVELPAPGKSGVFRVFIAEDVQDSRYRPAGTRVYRLSDPANTGDTARVSVVEDSKIGSALSALKHQDQPLARTATVELSWTGTSDSPQLEISRFICWEFLGLGGEPAKSGASAK